MAYSKLQPRRCAKVMRLTPERQRDRDLEHRQGDPREGLVHFFGEGSCLALFLRLAPTAFEHELVSSGHAAFTATAVSNRHRQIRRSPGAAGGSRRAISR